MALLKTIASSIRLTGAAIVLLWLAVSAPLPVHAEQREYALKAVFLYNFCQFIEWPPSSFNGPRDPIVIGVVGSNPFGSLLGEAVRGEVARGRSIRLEFYQRAEQADCHILFIGSAFGSRVDLQALHRRGIVTVGETESFISQGGMIALLSVQNRVRLRVNLPVVRSAGIEMSSKLLRVADINR